MDDVPGVSTGQNQREYRYGCITFVTQSNPTSLAPRFPNDYIQTRHWLAADLEKSVACGRSASRGDVDGTALNESTAADGPGRGPEALARLRAATVDICEVIPRTTEDEFHVTSVTRMIRNALLIETRASDQDYDRAPAHVARGVMDHFQITLCVEGEMRFSSGRREVTLRPGDIVLIDMAQPNRTALRAPAAAAPTS
ncbi:AraC-like ligand-binding domain-containing protein [Bradyrhizobium betae]